MGIVERKERDRTRMRQMITDAARKLFLQEGYEKMSIRALAEEIEYSPATIYLYFKDKDEILFALHNDGFQKLIGLMSSVMSIENPKERLRGIGLEYVRFAMENPELYDLMFIMRAPAKEISKREEWVQGECAYDMLRKVVRECMEKKMIPLGDIESATFAFWATVHGFVSLFIRGRCSTIHECSADPRDTGLKHVEASLEYLMSAL